MTTQYWTTNGVDIWRRIERTVCEMKNLDTGQVVRCEYFSPPMEYHPVLMPICEKQTATESTAQKAKTHSKKPTSQCLSKYKPKNKVGRSKHKGIKFSKSGKFEAHYWDKEKKTNVHLGTFDTEALAIEALETALKKKEEKSNRSNKRTFAEIDKPTAEKESREISVTGGGSPGDWEGA